MPLTGGTASQDPPSVGHLHIVSLLHRTCPIQLPHLLILGTVSCAVGVLVKRLCPVTSGILPMLLRIFGVAGLKIMCLIHFELTCMQCERPSLSLLLGKWVPSGCPVLPAHRLGCLNGWITSSLCIKK